MSEDPIRSGWNWYAYCGGNPSGLATVRKSSRMSQNNKTNLGGTEYELAKASDPTRSTTVTESDKEIRIRAYVAIEGDLADKIVQGANPSGVTYRKATIDGIIESWTGVYGDATTGKKVVVEIIDLNDGKDHYYNDNQSYTKIDIIDGLGVSNAMVSSRKFDANDTIQLYRGDSRDGIENTLKDFKRTAGHEMGHVLGLNDVYKDYGGKGGNYKSLMNYHWENDGAQQIDYEMLINAMKHPTDELDYSKYYDIDGKSINTNKN